MGTKPKGRKSNNTNNTNNTTTTNNNNHVIGKGKVTPIQIAYIVDRYLADNSFSQTRSAFHSDASSLVSKFSPNEAPKTLMSLEELLDEYIWLKEQKVIIEQEKCGLAQERCRIQTLLFGMQDVMNTYNSAAAANCISPPPPPPPPGPSPNSVVAVSSSVPAISSCPSNDYPASTNPVMTSVSMTPTMTVDRANFRTPTSGGRPPRKRRNNYKELDDRPQATKKLYCGPLANYPFPGKVIVGNAVGQPSNTSSSKQSPPLQSASPDFSQGGSPIQGSGVAKNLFDNPSQSPISNSSGPKTPPRAVSSPSDKSISPIEDVSTTAMSHHNTTPPETTPTNCTIISSKTIIVSPAKQYSIERNECTFSSPSKTNFKLQSKRDHVKGRLDFDCSDVPCSFENFSVDGSSTSESEKEGDLFDLDLSNFEAFGADFSLTELLTDFGIDCDNLDYTCPSTTGASTDGGLESFHERNGELGTSQDRFEHSSETREVFAADRTVNGSGAVTSVKSVRKCIRIVSPTKSSRISSTHC